MSDVTMLRRYVFLQYTMIKFRYRSFFQNALVEYIGVLQTPIKQIQILFARKNLTQRPDLQNYLCWVPPFDKVIYHSEGNESTDVLY